MTVALISKTHNHTHTMHQPEIYEVIKIGKGRLFAMPKPSSGEIIDNEFKGIARAGMHMIVSLLEQQEALSVGLSQEQALVNANGMQFMSFPIQDMCLPESVSAYSQLTKQIHRRVLGGCNTVIHCYAGIGRTGIVTAGVLLHEGFSPEDAFALISEKRGVNVPDTLEQREWVVVNAKHIVNA